jgi:hypothetical protein
MGVNDLLMTRNDAVNRAAALNAEHPDRGRHRWMAREAGGTWQVVRLAIPGGVRIDPLSASVESHARPNPAEDPRPLFDKNVGGPWAPGV